MPGVKVKKVDREPLKQEIAGDHQLKKADTVDKSAPVIDSTYSKFGKTPTYFFQRT